MSEIRVVVVLATFNGAKYLHEQLESLARQDLPPDLVVLRDDGSVDDTVAIAVSWSVKVNIKLQVVPTSMRLGAARSFLFALSQSPEAEIYLFCDQDDVWRSNKISRAFSLLNSVDSRSPHLIATSLQITDSHLHVFGQSETPRVLSFSSAVCENVLTGCTMAINLPLKNLLARELPAHLQMHDWWCYLLATATGGVTFDSVPTVLYRQHSENAIGVEAQGFKLLWRRLVRYFGNNDKVRSRQLAEFSRIHRKDISFNAASLLDPLIQMQSSIWTRLLTSLTVPIVRQSRLNEIATRLSILSNRF
jgi:glycosyltransferase involved in cell wall biosynthesis